MENVWLASAVWLGLALLASIISIRVAMSVALVEIMVGAVAGNTIGLHLTEWVNFLAGFGAILLTFLAGTEIDSRVVRKHFWSSMSIGIVGFLAPYAGVLAYAHYAIGWSWPGRTFGTISALFGLTNHIIDREKYTILVTAVIGSAVVPTLIAQRWFQPAFKPIENESDALPSAEEAANV
ncbi:MAG: potassium transporter Kef [Bradyrhizobium sp.]|jgi:Kef-type K+ transport system membrane component KefB|nr:potassium transporter Kef [Bradyrhizobium sp.]